MADTKNDDLLSETQVAEEFFRGLVSVRTIQTWRRLQKGPPYVKIGHRVFYRRCDLIAYVERSVVTTEIPPVIGPK
jgi:hypothetical protein